MPCYAAGGGAKYLEYEQKLIKLSGRLPPLWFWRWVYQPDLNLESRWDVIQSGYKEEEEGVQTSKANVDWRSGRAEAPQVCFEKGAEG